MSFPSSIVKNLLTLVKKSKHVSGFFVPSLKLNFVTTDKSAFSERDMKNAFNLQLFRSKLIILNHNLS